jgi:uncharacterized protein YecT (DUF1311 family)
METWEEIMKKTTAGVAMCMALLAAIGNASANSTLGQPSGGDSYIRARTAEAAAQDPIDTSEKECLKSLGMSTAGILDCLSQSYEKWDARLNTVYGELSQKVAPEAAASIQTAQKTWLAYRDANDAFAADFLDPVQMGSLGRVESMSTTVQIVRERALTVQNHLSLYDGSDGIAIDDAKTPIDTAMNACLEQNLNTIGMKRCISQASDEWDAEMNKVYGALKQASPKAAASLKTAQRAWLCFRDAQSNAIAGVYGGMQGTMYGLMAATDRMDVVRQRTLILKNYAEEMGGGE